jgi:signal transduction histidine kinase
VNLDELVTNVIEMLAPPTHIRISVDATLPTIVCEKARMQQVFRNLLDNAVKFMDKPKGQIRIACERDDGDWKFSVSDNGPGIEEKHFMKIFQIFQTLSPRDRFEGTGIGLTVAKKIVEAHGGRIWVQSKVGDGSIFYFSLPASRV